MILETTGSVIGQAMLSGIAVNGITQPSGKSVNESGIGQTPLSAALKEGLDNIDYEQTITFTPYYRVVLPLDGFVFWVRSGLITPGSTFGTFPYNAVGIGSGETFNPASEFSAPGSLHYATTNVQDPAESM